MAGHALSFHHGQAQVCMEGATVCLRGNVSETVFRGYLSFVARHARIASRRSWKKACASSSRLGTTATPWLREIEGRMKAVTFGESLNACEIWCPGLEKVS